MFNEKDIERILLRYAQDTSVSAMVAPIGRTFKTVAQTFLLNLVDAVNVMENWSGVALMFVEGYEGEIQALLEKGVAQAPRGVAPTSLFRTGCVRVLERTISSIEGS